MDRASALRKFGGAGAVVVLHIMIVAAFLSATRWHDSRVAQTREIILRLVAPQLPKVKETANSRRKITVPRRASHDVPLTSSFSLPKTLRAPQTNGLSGPFFDCSPDQLTTATPEQRAACASASLSPRYDPNTVDFRDHTDRSKSAALWARDRARKNAPLLLPCMSPAGFSPLYTAYCLGKAVVQGKVDSESQTGYQDMPDHATNEGDTRMAPAPH